jgi:hypothetical protein
MLSIALLKENSKPNDPNLGSLSLANQIQMYLTTTPPQILKPEVSIYVF